MYDAGHHQTEFLDLKKLKAFVKTIDWSRINSIGFYGGEVTCWLDKCQKYINLFPKRINKFIITNGAWSKDYDHTLAVIDFVFKNNLWCKISRTKEHQKHQNISLLKELQQVTNGIFHIKERDDTDYPLNPMGRSAKKDWKCSFKCLRNTTVARLGDDHVGFKDLSVPVYRFAIEPNGNIIFQNCDGVYPIVSNYELPFSAIKKECDRCPKSTISISK